ncbi:hypothetical protein GCM10028772_22560 [Nocardioides ultimimeridianus]
MDRLDPPQVRYARSGDLSIAWQEWGSGEATILAIPPLAQNIEVMWEQRAFSRPLRRFGAFARLVQFDKRGTGLSDPVRDPVGVDQRMEDILAVMDAAGIERAFLMGLSEGGPMSLLFAAEHPERVAGLILVATGAGDWFNGPVLGEFEDGLPPAHTVPDRIRFWEAMIESWGAGDGRVIAEFAPCMASDAQFQAWAPRYQRSAASPAMFRQLVEMVAMLDVSARLPEIGCPALVIHDRGDRVIHASNGRALAARLRDARYVEYPGNNHFAWLGPYVDAAIDEIATFVTGEAPADRAGPVDRWATLTPAERRVVAFARQGLSNGQIATTLVVSKRTVENQIRSAYQKLGVSSRLELLMLAPET